MRAVVNDAKPKHKIASHLKNNIIKLNSKTVSPNSNGKRFDFFFCGCFWDRNNFHGWTDGWNSSAKMVAQVRENKPDAEAQMSCG